MSRGRVALWLVALSAGVLAAGAARAEPASLRVAVLVGNNTGEGDEARLRYAEEDAAKMSRVLRDLGGFRPEDLIVLRSEDTEAVRHAIIRANERLRLDGGRDGMLVVYYSGHADAGGLHLGATRFAVDELEALVRGSSARMRILIVDACRSGSITRVKGGTPAPPFELPVRLAEPSEGAVFLTSSAANEDAQESDALRGSFFTHYLVSGLLGAADSDGDRRVTLSEAYAFAYEGTLRASSRSLGGTQHPTFSYDLRGHEDIVLTMLTSGPAGHPMGSLTLPSSRSFLVLQEGPEGPVVAETAAGAASHRLMLAPGRYFLRGRGSDDLLEGRVTLQASNEVVVREPELERVAYARLVRKGGGVRERISGVHAGYLLRSGLWRESDLCQGVFAAYEMVTSGLSLSARASACRGGFANQTLSSTADDFNLQVEGAHVWDFPLVSIHVGLGLGPSLLTETFTTTGIAPSRLSLAATLTAGAGVEMPLRRGFVLDVALATGVHGFKEQQTGTTTSRWTAAVTLVGRVGLGMRW
ncbi:MAG TPA: caspase family protein [Polyangia bacterium]